MMMKVQAAESLPSMHVEFIVVSRDSAVLALAAAQLAARVRCAKNGIANSSLLEMRIDDVSQDEFESLLENFAQRLRNVLAVLSDMRALSAFDRAEVRITIFSNSNLNAGVYLPRTLLDLVQSFELSLYFDAL
jgi:hypothetical protein